jgi:leucyl aminopeptidase
MVPTSTDVIIEVKGRLAVGMEAVAVFVPEGATDVPAAAAALLAEDERQAVRRLLSSGVSRGKAREIHFDLIDTLGTEKPATKEYRRVLVAGLGKPERVNTEFLRQAAGSLARACRKHRVTDVAAIVPAITGLDGATSAEAIVTGFLLGSFKYDEYKGAGTQKKDKDDERIGRTTLTLAGTDTAALKAAVARGRAIADGQNFARTIASRPGNVINPESLADVARAMAKEVGLGFRVLDEKQLAKLAMGGILAVGSASATPPRVIVLEHKGSAARSQNPGRKSKRGQASRNAHAPLLAVGKAITFDSGGISIKPADKMGRMIFDKCGGMAVLGLMYAIARLKLDVPVVGILSSAENTLSGQAYRPGDILRMYNGVTVEVTNTDAEGRLVLGDALAWGIEQYKPAEVVDLATLTGGVIVALGSTMAGAMSNSDALVAELQAASDRAGERFWRLPLNDDHRDYIKSNHADIVNSGGREGHPLQGGAFLSFFVPRDNSLPWAHLDIAGVADTDKELPYYAKGATGWGVRTLVEWATAKADGRARTKT